MTEVARKGDRDQTCIASGLHLQQLPRTVIATVVDDHDLVRPGMEGIEDRANPAQQLFNSILFVIEWYSYGDPRR
jgi:hypothetical protein